MKVNMQEELANKSDNCTASYKHCTGRTLVEIEQWCLYNYSIPYSRGETHLKSLCNK